MAEYVNREGLLRKFDRLSMIVYPEELGMLRYSMERIKEYPISDVAPVVHGRWEFRNDGRYRQTRCYCSACGKHSGIGGIRENQLKPYCPNCGAKMDGKENE